MLVCLRCQLKFIHEKNYEDSNTFYNKIIIAMTDVTEKLKLGSHCVIFTKCVFFNICELLYQYNIFIHECAMLL